jgi:hypothetical protein
MRYYFCLLAVLSLFAGVASAQVTLTTPSQNQVVVSTLPPIGSCFICDCNSSKLDCNTSCQQSYTEPVKRQQCEATCGYTYSNCLENAQVLQRSVDDQRAAALATTSK